jgi:hypothetical protein
VYEDSKTILSTGSLYYRCVRIPEWLYSIIF